MYFEITHKAMNPDNTHLSSYTLEKTKSFTLDDIDQVYFGQLNCCACGCGGDYYDIKGSYDSKERSLRMIKRAIRKLSMSGDVSSLDDYIFELKTETYDSGYWGDSVKENGIRIYLKENKKK